ncbi:hypothetical protein, partial [Pseudomonas viridiflava]|uniref:hypothetical protein n=1 Tax=Pseudomonas viridiflava TaxID=33069 RepID=UPI00197E5E62
FLDQSVGFHGKVFDDDQDIKLCQIDRAGVSKDFTYVARVFQGDNRQYSSVSDTGYIERQRRYTPPNYQWPVT